MKKVCILSAAIILSLNLISCSNIVELKKSENNCVVENANSEIVLGEKIENLFTIEKVNARNAINGDEEVEANHIYFRCRTDNVDLQQWLSEKFDFLSIIPLDREIVEGGTIYKDPELSEDEIPWFYLMEPLEDYNEVVEKGIETEILDEMYLDEEDISVLSGEGLEIPEDGYLTVDVDETVNRSLWSKIKKFFKKYIANKPSGKVLVLDTITKDYVPVKGVKVMSNQLGVLGINETDKNGKFSIPRAYTSLGGQVQMMIVFENSNITINSPERFTNFLGSMVYYEGSHWIEGISGMTIKAGNNGFISKCATIMNAYSDYCDFCSKNKITRPENLSIWTVSRTDGACTTLLRHITGTALPVMSNALTDFFGIPVPSYDRAVMPDIIIGTQNANGENLTESIYSNMFHELSHASHYF